MNTKTIFAFTLIIIFVGVAAFVFYRKSNNVSDSSKLGLNPAASVTPLPTPTPTAPTIPETNKIIKMENGLQIQDLVVGTGTQAKAGDTISVNYVGALENGTVFDASEKHGGPATFQIGVGQLIKGWDEGIPGMKVGGKRKLIVPPSLGYGSQDVHANPMDPTSPVIMPANSTLIFEVELVGVK